MNPGEHVPCAGALLVCELGPCAKVQPMRLHSCSVNKLKKRVGLIPESKPPRPYAKQGSKPGTAKGSHQRLGELKGAAKRLAGSVADKKQQGQQKSKGRRQSSSIRASTLETRSNRGTAKAQSLPKPQVISGRAARAKRGRGSAYQSPAVERGKQAVPKPVPSKKKRGRSVAQTAQAPPPKRLSRQLRGSGRGNRGSGGEAAAPVVAAAPRQPDTIAPAAPLALAMPPSGDAAAGVRSSGTQGGSSEVSAGSLPGPPSPASVCAPRKGNRTQRNPAKVPRARQAAAAAIPAAEQQQKQLPGDHAAQPQVEATPTACNAHLPSPPVLATDDDGAVGPSAPQGGKPAGQPGRRHVKGPGAVQGGPVAQQGKQEGVEDEEAARRRGRLADLVLISRQAWGATGAPPPAGNGNIPAAQQVVASSPATSFPAATPVTHAGGKSGAHAAAGGRAGQLQGRKGVSAAAIEDCGEEEQMGGAAVVGTSKRGRCFRDKASHKGGVAPREEGPRAAPRMTRRRAAAAQADIPGGDAGASQHGKEGNADQEGVEPQELHTTQPAPQRASGAASTTHATAEPQGPTHMEGVTSTSLSLSRPPLGHRGATVPRKQQSLRVHLLNKLTPVSGTPGGEDASLQQHPQTSGWAEAGAQGEGGSMRGASPAPLGSSTSGNGVTGVVLPPRASGCRR
jgi:hypothetical protein